MSWHAVDALDDAVDATRRFLFPFSLVRWAKLALLVLLMGGGASVNASLSAVSDAGVTPPRETVLREAGSEPEGVDPSSLPGDIDPNSLPGDVGPGSMIPDGLVEAVEPGLIAIVAVGIVLLLAALSVASLSLRLVFYDALRTNEVRIWRPFLGRLRQSLGLFVFTAVLSAAATAPIALGILVATVADAPVGVEPIDSVAGTLGSLSVAPTVALGLLGGTLVVVAVLALRFTYEFVVPTMVVRETGVIGGWRRFWSALRAEWTEVVVYLLVHVVVSLGLSVVEGIATAFALAVVATVAGLVLLLVAVALGGLGALVGTTVGGAALVLVALVGIAVLVALILPVQVVTRSYRITYEVATLGGIDGELALLHSELDSESRGASRAETGDLDDP
jgi:hypothetical protein